MTVYAVLLLSGIVLVQTVALALVIFRLDKKLQDLEPKLLRTADQAEEWMERAGTALDWVENVQTKLPGFQGKISRASQSLTTSLSEIDEATERLFTALRQKTREADHRTDVVLLEFAEMASRVRHLVSSPARQVSAAIWGVQTALSRYFSGRNDEENTPYEFHPDQQTFI